MPKIRHAIEFLRGHKPLFFFDNVVLIEEKPPMAKKPGTNPKGEFAFFNVVYRTARNAPTGACRPSCSAGSTATSRRAATSWNRTARSPRNPAARRWRSRASPGRGEEEIGLWSYQGKNKDGGHWPAVFVFLWSVAFPGRSAKRCAAEPGVHFAGLWVPALRSVIT